MDEQTQSQNPTNDKPETSKYLFIVGAVLILLILIVTTVLAVTQLTGDEEDSDDVASSQSDSGDEAPADISEVARINTEAGSDSCIILVRGDYYDVEDLRGDHPGGDVFDCGTDMTDDFNDQHGMDYDRLQPYKYELEESGSATENNLIEYTTAQLAEYDQPGNCYIAYKGDVYDVSNESPWEGCSHKGVAGGQDVSEISSPHDDSIYDGVPVVGILVE